jgi:15-cis-phytoene desaturase
VIEAAAKFEAREPAGVKGEGAIAFGGGASFSSANSDLLKEVDPAQFTPA